MPAKSKIERRQTRTYCNNTGTVTLKIISHTASTFDLPALWFQRTTERQIHRVGQDRTALCIRRQRRTRRTSRVCDVGAIRRRRSAAAVARALRRGWRDRERRCAAQAHASRVARTEQARATNAAFSASAQAVVLACQTAHAYFAAGRIVDTSQVRVATTARIASRSAQLKLTSVAHLAREL